MTAVANDRADLWTARALLAIAWALATLFCIAAAVKTWPVIDGDGPAYFPAAVEWSAGRALTNPVWLPPLNDSLDGPGGRRYIYHGVLYQRLVGALARPFGGGPRAAVAAAYVLHWFAAIAGTLAILSWANVSRTARMSLAAVLPLSMLGLSVAWHGRVE